MYRSILLATCLAAVPAFAGEAYDQLNRINEEVNRARKLLLRAVGKDLPAEEAAIRETEEILRPARKAMKPDLEWEATAFKLVLANLKNTEDWLENSKRGLACAVAEKRIVEAHQAKQVAQDIDLTTLELAAEDFVRRARPEWKPIAQAFVARAKTLREANLEIPKLAAAEKVAAEKQAEEERYAQTVGAAQTAYKELRASLAAGTVPTQAQVSALESAIKTVAGLTPPRPTKLYESQAGFARILLAWNKPDPEAQKALATQLAGELVASGTAIKKFSVPVKAKADTCYALLGHLQGKGSALENFAFAQKGNGPALQEFNLTWAQSPKELALWQALYNRGFCTTKPAEVTVSADLPVAGKSGLRFALLAFPRAKFPVLLASHLSMEVTDHCDPEYWGNLFLRPIPGTLAYLDGEPVVLESVDDAGINGDVRYRSPSLPGFGRSGMAKKSQLSSSAPKEVRVKPLEWQECPNNGARGPAIRAASLAIDKCWEETNKKYAEQYKEVLALKEAGERKGAPSAQAAAAKKELDDAFAKDFKKSCQPIADKVKQSFEETFRKLSDQLTKNRPADPIGRADFLVAEEQTAATLQ